MILQLFKFIKEKFNVMPEWLQILTYILFIFCFSALLFSPKYIDVRLVSSLDDEEFPIGEVRVEIETADRVITMVTDGRGRFSVPIGLANPLKEYTFVLYPDSKTKRQIDIKVRGHKAFFPWNKLTYIREKDEYRFSALYKLPFTFIAAVHAQDSIAEFRSMDNVDDVVIEAISKTTGIKTTEINLTANLSEDLSLSNYDLSYITYRINKEFGIDAWDKIWENALSPEDIIAIDRALYYQDKPWGEHLVFRNKNLDRLLSEAKDKYPQVVYEEFLTARIFRKSGNNEKSLELLEKVLSKRPDFYLAKYNQALAYDSLFDSESAKSAYEDAINLQEQQNFTDASLFNSYGRLLYRSGKYKESLKMYIKVREIEPGRAFLEKYINDSLEKLDCKSIEECITNQSTGMQ